MSSRALLEMLRRLEEEREYDIRERIAGRHRWGSHGLYRANDSGLLLPPMEDDPPYPPWRALWPTYGGISRSGIATPVESEEEREARARAEKAEECCRLAFEALIDNVGASEAVELEKPTSAPPSHSPDYMQTVTGWRGWDVTDNLLASVGIDRLWQPRMAVAAHCAAISNHAAPDAGCACGYWSFKSSELMKKSLNTNYRDDIRVVGSVEIWGRVIECENGYRSEFAYPKELWLLKPGLEFLSWTYGVPVRML
jgi:hypothetical protein